MRKIEETERKDILFIRSALPTLNFLSNVYKAGDEALLTPEFLGSVIEKLEKLIYFILDITETDEDTLTLDGIPPEDRQRLVKDMKIIEILTDILYYSFEMKIVDLNTLSLNKKRQLRIF